MEVLLSWGSRSWAYDLGCGVFGVRGLVTRKPPARDNEWHRICSLEAPFFFLRGMASLSTAEVVKSRADFSVQLGRWLVEVRSDSGQI